MTLSMSSAFTLGLLFTAPLVRANELAQAMPRHCHELTLQFAAGILDGVNIARTNPPRAEIASQGLAGPLLQMNRRLNEAHDEAARTELVQCVDRGVIAAVKPVLNDLPSHERAAVRTYLEVLARMGNYEEGTVTRATVERMAIRAPAISLITKFMVGYPVGALLAPTLIGFPAHPSALYYTASALCAALALVVERKTARQKRIHLEGASSPLRACAVALAPTLGD